MLRDLKTFGIRAGYFEIKRIGDFPNAINEGYSHINTKAIDFDTTTVKLCGEQKQESFKSCDALDIVESKNRMNLIEFKQLIDNETITTWIEDLKLHQKIKGSWVVLLNIIKKSKFNHEGKEIKFNACEKNVVISFSLTDDATKRLSNLFRYPVVEAIILKQFYNNNIQGENFNDPVCIRMAEFDAAYLKYA